ncbi:MAG: hypothetical protein MJ233_04585 [Mycoplasmoidaceae bacterium]|nr:hypothetical protein [Mycoplasmoidaceae bacterium]
MPLIIYQFALIPTMTTYTFAVIGLIFECVIKSKHMQLAKQMHITELQLAKVLVKEAKGNNRSRIQLAIILCTSFIVAFASTTILVVFTTPSINPNIPYLDPSDPVTSTSVITLSVIGAVL